MTKDILMLADGYVDTASVDAFCMGTICTVSKLYDQSGNGNHIGAAKKGNTAGGATGAEDDYESSATKGAVTLNKGGAAVSLTNVADASERADAVNLGQLVQVGNTLATGVATVLGGGAAWNPLTGTFTAYGTAEEITKAGFLKKDVETQVFVRFSTVLGSRGSADTVRDTRGFAVKFYTDEGNFDLVGNNIPVFFIQDAIKFPDIIHAAKPHPDREIPQAQSAHDTFWDFVSLHTEAQHHTMWNMSDRGIPRSYRMMEGFGVHTFRCTNAKGKPRWSSSTGSRCSVCTP
jgi:hypothetical protein